MADELLATRDETQDDYDRAAWDYIDRLREMTPAQAAAHFAKVEWIKRWEPDTTRCDVCGEVAQELKWSREHTEWKCMELTCGNKWDWRKR